jgi:endo-1,4-beta-D-glucanase Y
MDGVLENLKNSIAPKISESITNSISAECMETLKLVKSITSHYRHTNKPVPTEPSYFIPTIFKPFHTFVEQNEGWTDNGIQLEWAQIVGKSVITQYTSTVNDMLTSMTKAEESLKKLKNSSKKSAASEGNISDEDKIRLQIYLDVEQFGHEVMLSIVYKLISPTSKIVNAFLRFFLAGSIKDRQN